MAILAQYSDSTTSNASAFVLIGLYVLVLVFYTVVLWRIFTKAGEPGWYSIIPFFNTYTLIKIAGRPGWWLLLFFVPCVSYVVAFIVLFDLAKAFGRSSGFGVGTALLSPIFLPILAFGSSEHYRTESRRERELGGSTAWAGYSGVPAAPTGAPPWPRPGAEGTPQLGTAATPPPLAALPEMPAAPPPAAPTPAPPAPKPTAPEFSGPPAAPEFTAAPASPEFTAPPATTELPSTPVPPQAIAPTALPAVSPSPPAVPPEPAAPPAGWYPDPAGSAQQRYWDGTTWTDHLH